MDEVVAVLRWLRSREWVATLAIIQGVALVIADRAQLLPDGSAKAWTIAVAGVAVALVQRAGVWSRKSVEEIARELDGGAPGQ